jgi:hypothetical protein
MVRRGCEYVFYHVEIALDEIAKNRGNRYDPEVIDVSLAVFKEHGFTFE